MDLAPTTRIQAVLGCDAECAPPADGSDGGDAASEILSLHVCELRDFRD